MVVEPWLRMGPPPRSLAAEAHDCFMVRSHLGPTEYKFAARASAPHGGLPSVRLLSTGGIATNTSPPNPLLPRHRQAEGKPGFCYAERQARRQAALPPTGMPSLHPHASPETTSALRGLPPCVGRPLASTRKTP
jgi:hypothetical protein